MSAGRLFSIGTRAVCAHCGWASRQTDPAPLNTSTQAMSRAPEKEPSKEAQVCTNTADPADMARLRAENRRQGRPAARGAMSPGGATR